MDPAGRPSCLSVMSGVIGARVHREAADYQKTVVDSGYAVDPVHYSLPFNLRGPGL
jgi:hypothetical protein